eukprot:Gb_37845 [translate_table: standard]
MGATKDKSVWDFRYGVSFKKKKGAKNTTRTSKALAVSNSGGLAVQASSMDDPLLMEAAKSTGKMVLCAKSGLVDFGKIIYEFYRQGDLSWVSLSAGQPQCSFPRSRPKACHGPSPSSPTCGIPPPSPRGLRDPSARCVGRVTLASDAQAAAAKQEDDESKGGIDKESLVNKPQDETIPKEACKIPIAVATNHLDHGEIKEEVIAIQALEDPEQIVEHIINMLVRVEDKNQDFKFMEELT